MAAKLKFTRDELMASHDFARPHDAAGYKLHGGFLDDGSYMSPRVLHRWPAVRAWGEKLAQRGWPLIDASGRLLAHGAYPSYGQQKFLLENGFGQGLWNTLTITGIVEARGQALCNVTAPDMQAIIVEDIAQTATGHLNAGLLYAHGADEGGDPARPEFGAHDAMWFAVRDLVLGKNAYPIPEAPASLTRPVADREMAQIGPGYEQLIKFLMNVLMIEVRAESLFAFCVRVFRDPDVFADRREAAELAATMVERIRADEAIHVGYLQAVISELRSFTIVATGGARVPGAAIIDPVWARMVEWHGDTERELAAARSRAAIEAYVTAARKDRAGEFLARFDALGERKAAAA